MSSSIQLFLITRYTTKSYSNVVQNSSYQIFLHRVILACTFSCPHKTASHEPCLQPRTLRPIPVPEQILFSHASCIPGSSFMSAHSSWVCCWSSISPSPLVINLQFDITLDLIFDSFLFQIIYIPFSPNLLSTLYFFLCWTVLDLTFLSCCIWLFMSSWLISISLLFNC